MNVVWGDIYNCVRRWRDLEEDYRCIMKVGFDQMAELISKQVLYNFINMEGQERNKGGLAQSSSAEGEGLLIFKNIQKGDLSTREEEECGDKEGGFSNECQDQNSQIKLERWPSEGEDDESDAPCSNQSDQISSINPMNSYSESLDITLDLSQKSELLTEVRLLPEQKNFDLVFVFGNKKCARYLTIEGDTVEVKQEGELRMKNGKPRKPRGKYDKYQVVAADPIPRDRKVRVGIRVEETKKGVIYFGLIKRSRRGKQHSAKSEDQACISYCAAGGKELYILQGNMEKDLTAVGKGECLYMVVDYANNQIEWFVNGKFVVSEPVTLSDEPDWYVFVTLQDRGDRISTC